MTDKADRTDQKAEPSAMGSTPSASGAPAAQPSDVDPRPQERMLTTGEAAGIIGVDAVTMRRWCARYQVPHVTLPSGRRRFPERAFLRWVRETFEMTGDVFS